MAYPDQGLCRDCGLAGLVLLLGRMMADKGH